MALAASPLTPDPLPKWEGVLPIAGCLLPTDLSAESFGSFQRLPELRAPDRDILPACAERESLPQTLINVGPKSKQPLSRAHQICISRNVAQRFACSRTGKDRFKLSTQCFGFALKRTRMRDKHRPPLCARLIIQHAQLFLRETAGDLFQRSRLLSSARRLIENGANVGINFLLVLIIRSSA